ncbi:Hypothetical protein PHPALM_704 [Phytophthora palmivora]|uniref:Reverse transcriptase Ty1/copia-type domain-containing protein n=1 Tax=Phytophthora palmivora TaxID=4796 RepID=A0A2P4YU67_9STRA|nr:Hypothetical protein PHPALM_704 [Phytophthora palmivora]
MNRTIVEMARSMVHYMGLDLEWWGEAVNAAVYTINWQSNTARTSGSPFEVFYGKRPDLPRLRVFGSRGFAHVEKVKRSKWDAKANRCIFLGLPASDTNGTPAGTALTYNAPELLENGPATTEVDNAEPSSGDDYKIALAAVGLPRNYREAVESPYHEQWKKAIRAELRAHFRNHTWDLMLQTFGVDYTDTYSPVASMYTVRTFLVVCCCLNYYVKQYDIETTLLNGDFSEKVYMTVPTGMKVAVDLVCQLRRSLYGLKQAAAVWYRTIWDVFRKTGFAQCATDPCLFVKQGGRTPVFVILYVDDLLVWCLREEDAEEFRRELGQHFTVKALGDVCYVLGMYKQFIERMVEKFRQEDAYPVRNPTVLGQDLHVHDGSAVAGVKPFRELIGSLFGVHSRYLEQPREKHWKASIRILRYLKGPGTSGIKFHHFKMNACSVEAFCDANWGGGVATRRSTSGIIVQVAGGPVIYKRKLPQAVALSSAEAEYMSMDLAVQEVVWLRQLLEEMGPKSVGATPVFVGNKSANSMATNHGYTPRAKHIDLRTHFVHDHVSQKTIEVIHVPSAQPLADYLTKPLPTPQFTRLVRSSGVVEQDAS